MKKLSGYPLIWKLLLVPFIATVSFVAYLIYSSLVLSDGNFLLREIRDTDSPKLELAEENIDSYTGVVDALNSAATTGEVEFLNVARSKASAIQDGYRTLKRLDSGHGKEIEKLESGFNAYFALANDVAQRLTSKADKPSLEQISKLRAARDAYLSASVAYRDVAEKEFNETVGKAIGKSERAQVWGAVIGMLMLLVIALLTWAVTRGIVALENKIVERNKMLAAANSKLEHEIEKLKATEHQLRDLSLHLQAVREEEKNSIAREIHDDLGGTLTALKIETYWLADKLPANKETTPFLDHVKSMSQLIDNAVSSIRRIISDLRPTVLDDLGLLAAIEWQCAQFQQRTGIECWVNCIEDKGKLDKQYSIALFRIFQEALTNISRHSGASRVEVEFHHGNDEVALSITDNGCGMPDDYAVSSNSYGILGMRERVEQLKGRIKFDTPPGGGFSVTVILPMPANNK